MARHRIDRNPHAAILEAFDVVVRLVLVPGRGLARAGLLGQHVVVVQARGPASHQMRRGLRQRCFEDGALVVRVVGPATEVFDEQARVVGQARDFGARAGRGEVRVDALAKNLDLGGTQQAANAHRAIRLVGVDGLRIDALKHTGRRRLAQCQGPLCQRGAIDHGHRLPDNRGPAPQPCRRHLARRTP